MKRIYVDVDDVVSKTTETYTRTAAEEFGKIVSFEALTSFDLKASFDLTDNEFHYFFDLVHQPDRLLAYDLVEGADHGLRAWKEKGYWIEIVTGRPTSAREATLAWLESMEIDFDAFIMVDKYNRPGNDLSIAVSKEELAARPYDLAVEDSAEMALFLAGEMGVKTALISKPWNLSCQGAENLIRCKDWDSVAGLV